MVGAEGQAETGSQSRENTLHFDWRPEEEGSSAGTSWPKHKRRPFVARFPTRCRPAVGDGKSRRLVVGGCCPVVNPLYRGVGNVPPFAGGVDVK
jgi:hypothetical protein